MIYNKAVETSIDVLGLVKMIVDIVVRYFGLLYLIIADCGLLFTFKF